MPIHLHSATLFDLRHVLRNLADEDRDEVLAVSGEIPNVADPAFYDAMAASFDGEPLCIFGAQPLVNGDVAVWMLCATSFAKHRVACGRAAFRWLATFGCDLYAYSWMGAHAHHRFLLRAGFHVVAATPLIQTFHRSKPCATPPAAS